MTCDVNIPILYSFRRCPYAIRARLALLLNGISFELREVDLKDKPASMLALSPKGTVPVLQLPDGRVIDESLDVIAFAWCHQFMDASDSNELFQSSDGNHWVKQLSEAVVPALNRYKYPERFETANREDALMVLHAFLSELNSALVHDFLFSNEMLPVDVAIFPFIRQFALVDRLYFDALPFSKVQLWLDRVLQLSVFEKAMHKYTPWLPGDAPVIIQHC